MSSDFADSGDELSVGNSSPHSPFGGILNSTPPSHRERASGGMQANGGRTDPSIDRRGSTLSSATHEELMANKRYKKMSERCDGYKQRAALAQTKASKLDDQVQRLQEEVKGLKKAESRRERIEIKMSTSLDKMASIFEKFDTLAADIGISLQATGARANHAVIDLDEIPTLADMDLPQMPDSQGECAALHWFEPEGDDGVSTPSSSDSSRTTPYFYVNLDGALIEYKSYRAARQTIRDAVTTEEIAQRGCIMKKWRQNGAAVKDRVMRRVYQKHSWVAIANGDWKFHSLASSVMSDFYARLKSNMAEASGQATPGSSNIPLKREHVDGEGVDLGPRKKGRMSKDKGKKEPAEEPANLGKDPVVIVIDQDSGGDSVAPSPSAFTPPPQQQSPVASSPQQQGTAAHSTQQQVQGPTTLPSASSSIPKVPASGWNNESLAAFLASQVAAQTVRPPGEVPNLSDGTNFASTTTYPSLASSVRTDLLSSGGSEGSASSSSINNVIPSLDGSFKEPLPLPEMPNAKKVQENVTPAGKSSKPRAAPGKGIFNIHNYKSKKDAKCVYAHEWILIPGNKGRYTEIFNADFNALPQAEKDRCAALAVPKPT